MSTYESTYENLQDGPFEGLLVLDHTSALAGPYCAQMLGDLGAEVIKLEFPGKGDQARGWGPPYINGESAYFIGTNRNKRSLTLNLATGAGREILAALVERADVLIQNVPRESSRKKLGLDEGACRARNPRLIWASISGFGNTGPYAEHPGYDVIAQGMSGTMAATGDPDSGPMRFPTPIADITTGLYTALAIVSSLYARERTGQGQSIDNSLLESQMTWLANIASSYLIGGQEPQKLGNAHPNIVPYQPFPTQDGWIIIAAGSERQWQVFMEMLGDEDIASDARFATNSDRLAHRDILVPMLSHHTRRRTTAEWHEDLKAGGISNGIINTPQQALADPHVLARGMIVEFEHPAAGPIRTLGNPMHLSGTPITYRRPAPLLGEHTDEILGELGYSDAQIAALRGEGIV